MSGPPRVSRRGAILGTVGIVAVSGCDTDDLKPHDATSSSPTAKPGQPSADERLVTSAVTEVLAATSIVAAAHRVPSLRPSLTSLLQAHRAHLAVLKATKPPQRLPRPATELVALAQVRVAEQTLQRQLAAASLGADSGALARLLASMSASIAQHLAVLPAPS